MRVALLCEMQVNKSSGTQPDRYAAPTVCRKPSTRSGLCRGVGRKLRLKPHIAFDLGKVGRDSLINPFEVTVGPGREEPPSLDFSSPLEIEPASSIILEAMAGIAVGDLSATCALRKASRMVAGQEAAHVPAQFRSGDISGRR